MAKKQLKLKKKYIKKIRKIKYFFRRLAVLLILVLFFHMLFNTKVIKEITYENNNIIIKLNKKDTYCILSNTTPTLNDNRWVKAENKTCTLNYDINNTNIYIKTNNKIIYKNNKKILFIKPTDKETIYIALNDTYNTIDAFIGNKNKITYDISNKDIIEIDDKGIIKAKSIGNTTLTIKSNDISKKINIIVTDLITKVPKEGYDYDKPYLPCNKYSTEENNLIDEILKSRINDAQYKTRAAVVASARFLTLEFPYRINYFYENGRQTTNNVDGEGRYYHIGMYLSSSKFKDLTGKSTGPKTWGCSLYSNPAHRNIDNGLDCSGFVSWCLLNAGFDVKDVGAGFSDNSDLTDFGELKTLTKTIATSDKIKVGDLLHSNAAGGHIAIIIGIDNENYYVAQALWYDEIGVIVSKIKKNKLSSSFNEIVFMDKYYLEDGNLTNMW